MNSRTLLYTTGIFMISCNFSNLVGLKRFYITLGGIRPVLSEKSLQQHVLENLRSSCRSNIYVTPLISEKLVEQSKLDHTNLKKSKEFDLMTSSFIHS